MLPIYQRAVRDDPELLDRLIEAQERLIACIESFPDCESWIGEDAFAAIPDAAGSLAELVTLGHVERREEDSVVLYRRTPYGASYWAEDRGDQTVEG